MLMYCDYYFQMRSFHSRKTFRPIPYETDCDFSLMEKGSAWSMHEEDLHSPVQLAMRAAGQGETPGVCSSFSYFGYRYATGVGHGEDKGLVSMNWLWYGAPKHWTFITKAGEELFGQ